MIIFEEAVISVGDQTKGKSEHETLLEKIYEIDPLIAQAAEKLKRLSEDPEIVRQYHEREAYLKRLELEREIES